MVRKLEFSDNIPQTGKPIQKGDSYMPIEKNNLIHANDDDPETLLENDNSKDLKLIDDEKLNNPSGGTEEHSKEPI
jgi:hypothetical protein